LRPDSAVLARTYADDFLNVTRDGDLRGKADRLHSLLSGEPRYERILDDDVRVRVFGDAALVTGRSLVRVRARGEIHEGPVRFARVFVRREGEWQLVMQQLTRFPSS
jgi:ketosteroid isomerase-like protein